MEISYPTSQYYPTVLPTQHLGPCMFYFSQSYHLLPLYSFFVFACLKNFFKFLFIRLDKVIKMTLVQSHYFFTKSQKNVHIIKCIYVHNEYIFHNGYSKDNYKNFVGGFINLIHNVQWFITKSEGFLIIFQKLLRMEISYPTFQVPLWHFGPCYHNTKISENNKIIFPIPNIGLLTIYSHF